MRFTVNVYPGRSHAVGYGGNQERLRPHSYGNELKDIDPARDKFIDELLAKRGLLRKIPQKVAA